MSSFKEAATSIPGLTHYYPLTDAYGPNDAGPKGLNGTNHGAVFGDHGATFNGKAYVELPDHDDFSAATTGQLSIVVFLTISNWKGAGASEYVHWMGKGKSGAHEYTFRHYVDGGSGEAATRQGRISFYHFNPSGGLGAGSYFQDSEETIERMVVGHRGPDQHRDLEERRAARHRRPVRVQHRAEEHRHPGLHRQPR